MQTRSKAQVVRRIKKARERAQMSMAECARAIGHTQAVWWSEVEKGKRKPKGHMLESMGKVVGLRIKYVESFEICC